MTTQRRSMQPATLQINDRSITPKPRETLLQAALRSGIDFPNSCRVGGCGACKCRLTQGSVKELTQTGYLLSKEEIDQGYVLACQSVPRSADVRVEVALSPEQQSVSGRVIDQTQITHDITRLTLALDQPLPYRAGQFANVSLEGLPGVTRSYSFATPYEEGAPVCFFIRRVPGGQFSTLVNDEDVVGQTARVDGPAGDFWLRPDDAPILLVAGGSGLAPILALLTEAARTKTPRSATLLFGAREEKDLYALAEIEAIAAQWPGDFRFIPVLSATNDDAWGGARGLVTEKISAHLEEGSRAYLCGPPAMVDAALETLEVHGVAREHTYFDRFTTRADAAPQKETAAEETQQAGLLHYLKYFSFHGIGAFAVVTILAGGPYITAGLLAVLALYMVGDAIGGDDTSTPTFKRPGILTAQLWLALPLLSLIVFLSVWSASSGDFLGFGHWLGAMINHDVLAARDATTFGHHVSAWVLTGLMIGMVGTIPAHELTHRTWDPVSMGVGRWLLAFSFDTAFAIEHVYGHHRYVSTEEDPATAPRGRSVYAHVVISTLKGNVSAWRIEAERLKKRNLSVFSLKNAVIRGHLMSAALVALMFVIGGWRGAGFFVLCGLWGKALLEIVNYMEHYGMVRNPEKPVQPRHSWNTNRRVSSWSMFNLTRHSHHHAQGEVPYQELKPYPDAPMMISGYLTTIVVALIPPLWHRLMTPKVFAWDRDFANEEERLLARRANAKGGLTAPKPTPLVVHPRP